MKLILPAAAGLLLLAATVSCSESKNSGQGNDGTVTSYEVIQSVKTASKSYEIKSAEETYFLTLSVSMQWPEKFGESNVKVLQDSILYIMFNDTVATPVNDAVAKWVNDVDPDYFDANSTVTAIDSVPNGREPGMYNYEMSVGGHFLAYDSKIATYEVDFYSYTGGAHPNSYSYPFSYDLTQGVVLTADRLFKADKKAELLSAINENLAAQFNVSVSKLSDIGLFGPVTVVGQPFISHGSIVIRYNPYEIAPYSAGTIDVNIYPGAIADVLTPQALSLLEVEE